MTMLGKDMIQTLYDYNHTANQRIFEAAARLDPSQWDEPNRVFPRNLHTLLFHIVRTEWVWRELAQKRGQISTPPQLEDLDTLASIKTFEEEQACQVQAYLSAMNENNLLADLELTDRNGKKSTKKIWQMLVHPILHSMQHRSEAAAVLTDLGQSPGDVDFIFFI
jgi:uncharacterized damage-inducible protein DinB